MNERLATILRWLIVLAFPLFLGFTAITLIISDYYPRYQYGNPDFPADPFGFSNQERLELALVAVGYLQKLQPAEEVVHLIADQRIPGTDQPLYNQREIGHLLDVKRVTDIIRVVAVISGIIVIGGLLLLVARSETRPQAYRALFQGGILTTVILLGIALFIVLAWSVFFVQFHELLFPPGTWTFTYSDSLIRLFPEKFWFDLGVIVSMGTLVAGILAAIVGYLLTRFAS